jgi:HEAT repeat protein
MTALILALLSPPSRAAIEAPGVANLSPEVIEEFRAKGVPDEKWALLMETMGNGENTAAVRSLVREISPFPAARLVGLLSAKRLAVRLGALDLLEDAAGETFGFNAWQENPADGPNADALARWKTWAENGKAAAGTVAPLTEETFRVIAEEIVSGNRDRAERAMLRLDGHGLAAIAHIEAFLKARTDMEPASRAALKAAEYRVTLMQSLPKRAAAIARDLALGNAEAQSIALAALNGAGATGLPVIADFLASPDPLVRETAVDGAFAAGGKHAVPLILARLDAPKPSGVVEKLSAILKKDGAVEKQARPSEKANSVLHAMLRGLGKFGSDEKHARAIAQYMTHPDENVVISAIEALGACRQGDMNDELSPRLDDPRWRVRAAAIETIGKRQAGALKDRVIRCFDDPDLFVRVTAVQAIGVIARQEAGEILAKEFARKDDLKPGIIRTLFDNRLTPTPAMWAQLQKAPPEIILQCLDTLDASRDDHAGKRIPFAAPFARHPNKDVSAQALRLLASHGRHSALLLDALNSGDVAKQDAVLDQLHLLPGALASSVGGGAQSSAGSVPPVSNPKLDALYEAFKAFKPAAPADAAPNAVPTQEQDGDDDSPQPARGEKFAPPAEMRATLARYFKDGSPRQRFGAAVSLAMEGDADAEKFLLSSTAAMSGLDRRYVASAITAMPRWSAAVQEIATRLLRDEADDVREAMLHGWMENPDRIGSLLTEYSRPGSLITSDEVYGYELDHIAASSPPPADLAAWAERTLASAGSADAHKVMAIVLLARMGLAAESAIKPLLDSPNPWLRRAAYRALGLGAASARLDKLLADDSAHVRAALPFLASPQGSGWRHFFDDAHSADDSQDYDRSFGRAQVGAWANKGGAKAEVTPEIFAALEKLARDPSDLVRFEAMFALMRLSRPIDPAAFATLLVVQPEESNAKHRVERFLDQNYMRLGKAYGVLVPLAFPSGSTEAPKLLKHFGMERDDAFTSFSALAALAPAPNHAADTAIAPPTAGPSAARTEAFRVVFFHRPGCRECDRAREMLRDAARDFPAMLIEERDIGDRASALLNEALSARFGVADTLREVTPAVFAQTGALVRTDITPPRLGDLLRASAAAPQDAHWAKVAPVETAVAHRVVEERFSALGFGVVTGAGLLDGINPCAFATIIFLLSYLQVARRTPREILAVGTSFIAGVFLTYFAIGLGLAQAIAAISAFRIAGLVLNYALAASAFVVAVLSFRDAQLAARGELSEMTLQLSANLKTQIRGVIRSGSKAAHFVIAAFIVGIFISLLELACTGQVYLPTIQYMLKAGHGSAVRHLLVYNVAFILPLIVIFALAFLGLRSEALVRFQRRQTSAVKVLTGLLFLALGAFLLFGYRLFAG